MQDSSEDASDPEEPKATKKQNVSEEPFIRKGLLDDEHWLVGAGSEAEDIGGEKQKTKPDVITNTVGLAAEKSDKQMDLQLNGGAGAVCQVTSSQSIADGDVMQDGEDSASTYAAGSQEMVDRVGKQDGKGGDDAQNRQTGILLPETLQQDGHGEALLHGKQDGQVDGLPHETLRQNGCSETVRHKKVQSIGNKED
ncbi:hypothetical protein ABVK25_005888 [Lepraria finkii]|uniref:Uncharacterized protein n=1 Tax=Lepraria finkii TaxID=1340010 RepID=A0ABR4BAV5_9LECA